MLDAQLIAQRFGRDTECRAAGDHLCARRACSERRQKRRGRRRVVLQRDEIAVVDVSHGEPDDIRVERLRGFARLCVRIAREAEVEHAHIVARVIERGGDARHAVGHHWHGLALAIRADEQHTWSRAHAAPASEEA